jgi:Mrp family chromosome partitioning ATPase
VGGGADPAFDSVRTTLQSALKVPFAVTVSSSQVRDGKTELAAGTARAFAAANFNTIVVDAHPAFPGIGSALGVALPLPDKLDPAALAFGALRIAAAGDRLHATSVGSHRLLDDVTPATIVALLNALRSNYDVTILDTCDLFYDDVAKKLAAASDGVVLAVRYARNPDPEDARVVATLEKLGARIIGSVPTSYPGPFARAVRKLMKFS